MSVLTPREKPKRWSLDEVVVTDPPVIRKAIGAAAIGNITEWYDFGVYAYLATTIEKVFFPSGNQTLATLAHLRHLRRLLPRPPVRRDVLRPALRPDRP